MCVWYSRRRTAADVMSILSSRRQGSERNGKGSVRRVGARSITHDRVVVACSDITAGALGSLMRETGLAVVDPLQIPFSGKSSGQQILARRP